MIRPSKAPTLLTKRRLLCRLILPTVPPSYWNWRTWHWAKQRKLQDDWLMLLKANRLAKGPLPWSVPVLITFTIYKRTSAGDPANYVTPLDKLFLDNISMPKGNKSRGLGWITDDSPKHLTVEMPKIQKTGDKPHTLIEIWEA